MDIDPVETTIHIKTDSINLQKRFHKKNIKNNLTENETTNPTPKNETQATKSRHRSTSRSKEKEKNQKPTPYPPIETKNKLKIEMDSTSTFKKPGELKQKAQVSIGQAGRVNMNTEVISERPGGTFKLPPAKFDAVPSPSRTKSPMGIDKQSNAQGTSKSLRPRLFSWAVWHSCRMGARNQEQTRGRIGPQLRLGNLRVGELHFCPLCTALDQASSLSRKLAYVPGPTFGFVKLLASSGSHCTK